MAEVKNAFIKSKMNKDLDSRLIPSGEYRNALNAQISKSEGSDVGALESVLGNSVFINFIEITGVDNLFSIGHLTDEVNSAIYVFLTDNDGSYTDSPNDYIPRGVGVNPAPGSNHFIYKINALNPQQPIAIKLVEGAFLNFSRKNKIFGVNILEQLLFWTDNRNQPRKINVDTAQNNATYYSTEDHLSVAKYNPYDVISLYKESELVPGEYETTMKDVASKFLPNGGYCTTDAVSSNSVNVSVDDSLNNISVYPNVPRVGMFVKRIVDGDVVPLQLNGVDVLDVKVVTSYTAGTIVLNKSVDITLDNNNQLPILVISPNPYYVSDYNGDPSFLEDKFVRFSYRFKFDDGEYSIIAPFTQPCFIPKQDGYFLNTELDKGDQQQAYSSTVVSFMENKVNNIDLQIPLPSTVSSFYNDYHVDSIDILYKESDGLAIKVIETIDTKTTDFTSGTDSVYVYSYQSKKPYKTLPSKETTRVYDKVPVKALGQEIISNRIAYANFQDKHTPPASLNYNVNSSDKSEFNLDNAEARVVSDVTSSFVLNINVTSNINAITTGSIMTSQTLPTDEVFTVVSFIGNVVTLTQEVTLLADDILFFNPSGDDGKTTTIVEYPNSSLKTNRNYQVGFVLSDRFGRQSTVILSNKTSSIPQIGEASFIGSTLYSPYIDEGTNTVEWPGNSLKVSLNDPIPPDGPGLYNGDVNSISYNPLGWYSYKIVVKQTEQEYYNIYSAGAMKGLPYNYDSNDISPVKNSNTSFVTLLNDNINKIPRDLSQVGPQDKSFRSSVVLYGRVENNVNADNNLNNNQYYPDRLSFTTSSIEDLYDLFDINDFKGSLGTVLPITSPLNAFHGFFKSDSNPFIAEIITSQSSSNQFGVQNSFIDETGSVTSTSAVAGETEVPYDNLSSTVEIGSVITAIEGTPVDPAVLDFVVVNITGGSTGIVTLNRAISVSNNTLISFSLKSYKDIESLAIFETKPVDSRLDIFWETSSAGLISDINNLVINQSNAGAGLEDFNTQSFSESIELGQNISNSSFRLVDSFQADIPIADITSFTLKSVINGNSINVNPDNDPVPQNSTNYFTLYEPTPGTKRYNVKVTQEFINQTWYAADFNRNQWRFNFESIVNGVTTEYFETVTLGNLNPVMTADNTTPAPSEFTIIKNTGDVYLETMTAVNGAADTNPNTWQDLSWGIVANSEVRSNGDLVPGTFVLDTSLPTVSGKTLSTCVLRSLSPSNIEADVYSVQVQVTDGGQESITTLVNVNFGVIPTSVEDVVVSGGINGRATFIEIQNQSTGSNNGFYIYDLSWGALSSSSATISIDRLNGENCSGGWYWGSSLSAAKNRYEQCTNPLAEETVNYATTPVDTTGYFFEIIDS